jgi:hypothetical protein
MTAPLTYWHGEAGTKTGTGASSGYWYEVADPLATFLCRKVWPGHGPGEGNRGADGIKYRRVERTLKTTHFTSSAHRNIERYQNLKLILAMSKIPAFDRREASCGRSTIALFRPQFVPRRACAAERDSIGKQNIQFDLQN